MIYFHVKKNGDEIMFRWLRRKQKELETKEENVQTDERSEQMKGIWLCAEFLNPDGKPYDYREVLLTEGLDLTIANQTGHALHFTVSKR